jgi:hypothetical protein
VRCSIAIPSALVTSDAAGWLSIDDASAKRIENHGTVHLALASWVLGDVGEP